MDPVQGLVDEKNGPESDFNSVVQLKCWCNIGLPHDSDNQVLQEGPSKKKRKKNEGVIFVHSLILHFVATTTE